MPPARNHDWLRIGNARVSLDQREVEVDGQPARLSWRAFQALRCLVKKPGDVVSRTELFEELWPGLHIEESSLNHCILQLRRVLGDDAIETIPRVGYRLSAIPQHEVPDPQNDQPSDSEKPVAVVQQPAPQRSPKSWKWIATLAGAACGVAVLAGLPLLEKYRAATASKAESRRLTVEATHLEHLGRFSDILEASTRLQQAAALDPKSALTRARIAETMTRSGQANRGEEKNQAEQAVHLDPNCGECHAILGWILLTRDWQWSQAASELKTALRLNPADAYAHQWYSQLLAAEGRLPEALGEVDRAVELEPWNPAHPSTKCGYLYLSGRYDDAIAECHRSLALQPVYPAANNWLFRIYTVTSRGDDAVRTAVSSDVLYAGLSPDLDHREAELELQVLREGGLSAVARQFLKNLSGPQTDARHFDRAFWKMVLQDDEGAITELQDGLAFRPFQMIFLRTDPAFRPLHNRPDFNQLLNKLPSPA